ncbi:hypothetical protein BN874_1040003 [Candidatus Contendobacter odensis Run_B_J11]|uniref:Uncharacterized protein n=1 Tax=Candidatus Contendobacter odensis Run_B_J11 TaxID=1400861 RepID=A0A7U7G7U8_9GAMM|nr:hypothetical protein BN874_1040003 [Candidatus Contendobacter odensis Run_B_J11]
MNQVHRRRQRQNVLDALVIGCRGAVGQRGRQPVEISHDLTLSWKEESVFQASKKAILLLWILLRMLSNNL